MTSAPSVEPPGDLTVDSLTIAQRRQVLLNDCSFVVAPGEVLAVMGASGAGKTTLLRTVAGLVEPRSGSVSRPAGRVSMVFQDPRLVPWRTALANVELVLPADQKHLAAEWLGRVGLADATTLFPSALSGGMRQRVAIARALACDSGLVLVDEPFASLDADTADRLREMLTEELRLLRRPVLWVTHNAREAALVAPRILHMDGPPHGGWRIEPVRTDVAPQSGVTPLPADPLERGAALPRSATSS